MPTNQFATSQVSVSTGATQLLAARTGRTGVRLKNITPNGGGGNLLFLGPDNTVSITTGYAPSVTGAGPNATGGTSEYQFNTETAVWAITSGGTAVVQVMELWDA